MNYKHLLTLIFILAGVTAGVYFWITTTKQPQNPAVEISSFEECAQAGYPIMETYPEQCRTSDGKTFVKEIIDPIVPVVPIPEEVTETHKETVVTSGVKGNVVLGPTCPVIQNPPAHQCDDKPFQTSLVLTTMDGSQILKEFSSDSEGNFKVSIIPGNYLIRSDPNGPIMPTCFKNEAVEVKADSYTETTVYCDSGIR